MTKEEIERILKESDETLGNLTDRQIEQYNYNNFTEKQKKQFIERASKGGKKTMPKGVYGEIQKKGNDTSYNLGIGIHDKNNPDYLKWKSKAGKIGGTKQVMEGKGIHTDSETRREWARLGGLASAERLNEYKTCPHCKITTRGGGYTRWHGDNCKHKP